MGTYSQLTIADYPVYSNKSRVNPVVMSIFRESDKVIEKRLASTVDQLLYPYQLDPDEVLTGVEYSVTVTNVIERLSIMGFTLNASKAWFELGVKEKIETYSNWINEDDSDEIKPILKMFQTLTFEKYLEALSKLYEQKLVLWIDEEQHPDNSDPILKYIFENQDSYDELFGFPANDERHFLRAFLEVVPSDSYVTEDISALVESGYYELDELVCESAVDELISDYLIDSKVLILTEGSTDKNFLEPAFKLLYPHLADYFSFMDFGVSKAAGGASALVNTIKAFIGASIGNRIIALFDNDTAAKVALKSLEKITIPNTIKILHYPNIELCKEYPTLGPNGLMNLDINGLAGSIEVYLGKDVLEIDGKLTPVQWKGYDSSLQQYQGEVLNKNSIQKSYFEKIKACQNDTTKIIEYDWDGMKAIFQSIFDCFEEHMP